ncbi:putative beta-glucosidase M [Phialemonium atrogriseum]|uniref:beta-glucosidase n=1 Tax=Phialemonium atrogriseum TaxID=1093897 RepID=A0AAJ0FS93_9PEZI|nr:putative beta-glucosidase M [Phialemonium atrogriseum]KAK1770940.1 putative beta-glucosidase M [Phialemonium atrogriseum]
MLLVIIGGGLAGLAALPHGKACSSANCARQEPAGNISSDTYFYGQSPPVYPSPNISGLATWADAFTKAQDLVGQMTLEEKIDLTSGISASNGCNGNIPPIRRLKFPGLCLSDAGNGLRSTDFVSSWPSGLHVGASWNKELAAKRGFGMGSEFKKKGVNVLLGPVVGPLGRVALGGRNWEGFSNDPYLSGALVHETVSAIQGVGVITSTKHYIANEQESYRNPSGDIQASSSNIDDRTLHELYLWPFQDAIHAGSGNIMCSYNRVNNSYGCANSKTLNGILKTELGFQGFVVTDWGAQHAGVATALAGLDMAMPVGGPFWGAELSKAVSNGSVPESRITDMATRIIASWYQMGQDQGFPEPGIGMPASLTKPHKIVDARNESSRSVLFDGAVEGHVLLKNEKKALPLKKPNLLSIFGFSAKAPDNNNVGSGVSPWNLGAESFNFEDLLSGFIAGDVSERPAIAFNGTIVSGGGSGATSQSRIISPFDAITQQAYEDDTALFWDFTSGDPEINPASDACLVIVNAFASEGFDRPNLHDDYTDGLIKNVADKCNNTVVVFHNAGIRLVDQWIDHPNVTSLIFAHLPGQDSGKALVSILYGKSNPSGKLPYTVARNESDYGQLVGPDMPEDIFAAFPQSNYSEGVFIDYRHFDAKNITPRFEFGFGLSYTTFEYSNLSVTKTSNDTAEFPTGATVEGGPADLWDVIARATADVRNTGAVGGAEVAQLYVGVPGEGAPARQLRGFEKPFVNASGTAAVGFALTRRDLSVWDVVAQKWRLRRGEYGVWVGASSRDLRLEGKLVI